MENRSLDAHEALYLRFRHLKMKERGLRPHAEQGKLEIHSSETGSTVFAAASNEDLESLMRMIKNIEYRM